MAFSVFDSPGPWPLVVFPAVATALLVRLDAVKIGPYFALSDLIGALAPTNATIWYESHVLRRALYRRLLYPALLGFALGWASDLNRTDVAAAGALTAGLLVWPVVFHRLPWHVPRRSWHLPVLYISFVVAYGALALGGAFVFDLLMEAAGADVVGWAKDELLSAGIVWVVALFAISVFRRADRRTVAESERRRALGGERLDGHLPYE